MDHTEIDNNVKIFKSLKGNARNLSPLASNFPIQGFDVIVTSPPYWKRRDYEHSEQIGQEKSPEKYIEILSETIDSWRQWMAPHSSAFINLADTHKDGFLVGTPVLLELAMRKLGWSVAHRLIWSKPSSVPTSSTMRLASRHETILHLIPPQKKANQPYYFDRFALNNQIPDAEIGDVWHVSPSRGQSGHIAPFPKELVRRILLLSCPEMVCEVCGKPYRRVVGPSEELDSSRVQARRAMQLFEEKNLTEDHLAAIRAVGISDAGMGKKLQKGSGRNSARVQKLADEAKEALGGYFREFTFAPKKHLSWQTCECEGGVRPGWILDPFAGSNTSLIAAKELGFQAIGVDLSPHTF